MNELALSKKTWEFMCFSSLAACVYRPIGITGIDGAPNANGGTGFFIDANESQRYFFMTYHQYENCFKGTNIFVSPHNSASVSGNDLTLKGTCVYNDLQGEGYEARADDKFIKGIDIVLSRLSIKKLKTLEHLNQGLSGNR